MKKILAVVICLILLLPFVGCNSKTDPFLIGDIAEISGDDVVLHVAHQFADEYGNAVTVKDVDVEGADLHTGDEIRVFVKSVEDKNVTASKINLLLCVEKRKDIVLFDKQQIPEELLNLNVDEDEHTLVNSPCFYSTYRVLQLDEKAIYLADYKSAEAEYVIFGDFTSSTTVGSFVKVESKAHRKYGCYYVVFEDSIKALGTVSYEDVNRRQPAGGLWDKPVIYLYPENELTVDVNFDFDGKLNTTYPEISNGGWQGLNVKPDGTISKNGREYYCLFWEGEGGFEPSFSKGFCVKGEDTAAFLEKVLKAQGLNDKEANEFIIYWLPILSRNAYNLISFQGENYTEAAKLNITPTPQSVIRVFMAYKALEQPVEIEPQEFDGFERVGFTVVEWGGGEVK